MDNSIIFTKQPWNETACTALKPALYDDIDFVANEVKTGRSELFFIDECGWIVTRIEGTDLVLVAASGKNGYAVLGALVELAKKNKLKNVWIHSRRYGMERYLKKTGFQLYEKVFIKRLA
jgi:hypothetical protein